MHDPEVVVFEMRRPIPQRVNWGTRKWYFPSVVTVWHHEPNGADSGSVCPACGQSFDVTDLGSAEQPMTEKEA